MNNIINELIAKQIYMLPDEVADAEIYRTIQAINSNYILLNKTKKAVDLTKRLNDMFDYGFNYKSEKMPIGITFEELLIKAIAFQQNGPYEYIHDRCIVIEKNEDVLDFLDGIDVMYKLTGEENPNFTSNVIKLTTDKFKERINKLFESKFESLWTDETISLKTNLDNMNFYNDYVLMEFKVKEWGTEEDRKVNYLKGATSPMSLKVNEKLEEFTERLFGRKFNVNITEHALIPRSKLSEFDGNTIFRTETLIHQPAKFVKKGRNDREKEKEYFYCYAGFFLHYNQFCDVISKGSLK